MNEQICPWDRGQGTQCLCSVLLAPRFSSVMYSLLRLSPFLFLGTMKQNSPYMSNVKIYTREGF